MFALVAIAILGCCAVIDLLSGQPGRSGGAAVILVGVGIWLVYALTRDAIKDHQDRKERLEAFEKRYQEYQAKRALKIQELRVKYPGLTDYQYEMLSFMTDSKIKQHAEQNFQNVRKYRE